MKKMEFGMAKYFLAGSLLVAVCLRATAVTGLSVEERVGRSWKAQWIGTGASLNDWRHPVLPAPVFRKAFELKEPLRNGRLAVTGLGYFDCRIDGRPVSDGRLMPAPTQYDVRWRYRTFALPGLEAGRHVISITVGDGLYRPSTRDVWHFDKATWMAYPKAICELEDAEGRLLVKTDGTWEWRDSPVVFTALRGGETYDARLEFDETAAEEGKWAPVKIVPPPGGIGEEESFPPCRITAVEPMIRKEGTSVWSASVTLTGVPRLHVRGASGAKVTLLCGEEVLPDGKHVDMSKISNFTDVGEGPRTAQRDTYVLRGNGVEIWEPRFTYHGFRHVEVLVEGEAEIVTMEALEIGTDVKRQASFTASDKRLERVAALCERSLRSNFTGIPTDCPSREKNGWGCDARTFCEASMYAFDSASAWGAFSEVFGDTQRPSGQLSGMAPCSGWGYNWGGCPPWDSALFFIPERVYEFTGDGSFSARLYPKMIRSVDYTEGLLDASGVPTVGIGDWLAPVKPGEGLYRWPWREMSAAFRVGNVRQTLRVARRLGRLADAVRLEAIRDLATADFRRNFCGSDGLPVSETSTLFALALAFDLVPQDRKAACAAKMAQLLRVRSHRVDFGLIGVGFVLHQLFENGYADDAYRVMTQPEKPGFLYFSDTLHLTALPERWDIDEHPEYHESSMNHGYLAEYLACVYRYLGGFRHDESRPGPDFVEIRPCFPTGLDSFEAEYCGYCVAWSRMGREIVVRITVPQGRESRLILPGRVAERLAAGESTRTIQVNSDL